ncbi:2315_t:CDS:2, partial [Ambispora leptoticha]
MVLAANAGQNYEIPKYLEKPPKYSYVHGHITIFGTPKCILPPSFEKNHVFPVKELASFMDVGRG